MRWTPARRALLLLVVACLLGSIPVRWALNTAENLARYHLRGYVRCTGGWLDFGNNECTRLASFGRSYDPVLGWVELSCCVVLLAVVCWASVRWALAPFRAMTETVDRLGPTSLGLRLDAAGPADESRRLSDAIDALLDRVAEGYESQRRFAANASHELRTPLATQRTLIEVSLADAVTPEQLELLSRQLLATNERNENLVEGLLALAETERGLMARTAQRLDLITADVVTRLGPMADRDGVTVETDLAEASVIGEHPLLERLVSNLLQNAVKYNEPGGRVELTVAAPGTLTVRNSGPHVPHEAVPTLFEPFRRLSGERLQHGGGAGLGLTIARSIVAAHEGTLDARANPDGGLTLTARLRPAH